MDRNEDKNHPQACSFLTPLLDDACSLTQEELRERMDWAIQEAKSDAPLGGIPIPPPPENEFQIILAKMKERGITPKLMADYDEEPGAPLNGSTEEFIDEVSEGKTEYIVEEPQKVNEEHSADKPGAREKDNTDKLIGAGSENSTEKSPTSETSEQATGKSGKEIDGTPEKAEEAAKNIVEEKDKQKEAEGKGRGSKKNVFLQLTKAAGVIAAGVAVTVAVVMLKPGIDVVGKRNYEYKSESEIKEEGGNLWNNQENYVLEDSNLEIAYEKIKKELGIAVLKLNYIPEGMSLSKMYIEDRHARLEFDYKNSHVYMLEILYPVDNSEYRSSDRKEYEIVENVWMDKKITIKKNKISDDLDEYSASFEMGNALYYLQAIMEEQEFISIVENLTIEND